MEKKDTLVLLIHGYLGTPFEMEPFADTLRSAGMDVRMVTLPGHDSNLAAFRKTFYPDWFHWVESEYLRARSEYRRVMLVGYSLGGTLALDLAAGHHPDALAVISSPVFPIRATPGQARDWALLLLPVLRFAVKEIPMKPARPESRAIAPWQGYDAVAHPPQLHSLFRGVTQTRKRLKKVTSPLLVIHDVRDRLVNPRNALTIAAGVSSETVEIRLIRVKENVTSHHTITTHRESRERVVGFVLDFLSAIRSMPA